MRENTVALAQCHTYMQLYTDQLFESRTGLRGVSRGLQMVRVRQRTGGSNSAHVSLHTPLSSK